jgi:type III pantothenate kinase
MLLAVDVGNTSAKLGIFKGDALHTTLHMTTNIHRTVDEYAALLLTLLHHRGLDIADVREAALCSVVPPLIAIFDELLKRYFHVSPLVVGAGVKTGVRIRMDNPREVGPDRIVNAAAAHHLYGGPIIVADLGTAITFDTVSKEGDYLGGAISPGIATAAEALSMRTAMLPRIELVHPRRAIGTNTISAMQSGIVFGYAGLIEGIVARIQQELGMKTKVIATGGYAELIGKETSVFDVINPDLTLIGIKFIYEMNQVS